MTFDMRMRCVFRGAVLPRTQSEMSFRQSVLALPKVRRVIQELSDHPREALSGVQIQSVNYRHPLWMQMSGASESVETYGEF